MALDKKNTVSKIDILFSQNLKERKQLEKKVF